MAIEITSPAVTGSLLAFVTDAFALCQPDDVHWCDGSMEEYRRLCQTLVEAGTFEHLDAAELVPGALASR